MFVIFLCAECKKPRVFHDSPSSPRPFFRRGFDNDFFGIDIEEAQAISPSQRWVMEVGYEARRFGLRRGLRNWEANVCFFLGKFMAKNCLLERLVK